MDGAEFLLHHAAQEGQGLLILWKNGPAGWNLHSWSNAGPAGRMQLVRRSRAAQAELLGHSEVREPGVPWRWEQMIPEAAADLPRTIPVFNHYPESAKQLQTHTRLAERLVKTERVIHKFTKIPCSTEQCDSSADRSNISIQTGFGAGAINIPAIFPASEHKDSFTVLIK